MQENKNIQIKEIPPVIVYKYPKSYSYDEFMKNINYLQKIADKISNGTIISISENLEFNSNDTINLRYPIIKKLYAKYKREELETLPKTKVISYLNSDNLSKNLNEINDIINDKNYKINLPYRQVYTKQLDDNITAEIQVPLK